MPDINWYLSSLSVSDFKKMVPIQSWLPSRVIWNASCHHKNKNNKIIIKSIKIHSTTFYFEIEVAIEHVCLVISRQ